MSHNVNISPFSKHATIFQAVLIATAAEAASPSDKSKPILTHHIHLLKKSLLTEDIFSHSISSSKAGVLYQFGLLENLDKKSRRVVLKEQERRSYGNIGLGSVCRGDERLNHYIGGGEGFFWGGDAYRVTKGGVAFKVNDNQGYWFAQLMNFEHPLEILGLKNSQDVASNFLTVELLVEFILLELQLGRIPFMATFTVSFDTATFIARSNGLFPEDEVILSDMNVFQHSFNTDGGHLLSHNSTITVHGGIFVKPIEQVVLIEVT